MRPFSMKFAAAVAVLVLGAGRVGADDLLGPYAGVAIGQSHVVATGQVTSTPAFLYFDQGSFDQNHSAFQAMAGLRPVAALGAELDYLDLGHPSGSFNTHSADLDMRGGAAFGVLYLPVSIVDIYLKAGIARIQSKLNGIGGVAPNCANLVICPAIVLVGPFRLDRTNTSGAAGIGAQYKFGSLAVRAEYERFNAAGEHPSLLTLGVTRSF
jgi:opacity protein-like surface antigen